jgi:hypothetical protein
VAQVVEYFPNKHKAQNSNSNTTHTTKKRNWNDQDCSKMLVPLSVCFLFFKTDLVLSPDLLWSHNPPVSAS